MKFNYIKPDSSPVELIPWEMLLASGSLDASGQDYGDPLVVDYNDIF